jgi:iron complex outermembrane recepter protein
VRRTDTIGRSGRPRFVVEIERLVVRVDRWIALTLRRAGRPGSRTRIRRLSTATRSNQPTHRTMTDQPSAPCPGARRRLFAAALAVSAALLTPLAAQQSPPTAPRATTPADDTVRMDSFSVTGSRIKRIDAETPQPVVRLTEAEFKATGFTTVGDAIRAMPAISGQSLVSVDGGTSFTPGVSSFNLRGLGANNTLVLINGRRAAPFASAGFNGFQTVFDLNSIPVAAIESIEVLKDGASAIYGSDAVAGVINFNLKRDYTGLTSELSVGNTVDTDSFEKSAFVIFGAEKDKLSLVTTLDYSRRNGIYAPDLDYTDESDGRPYGGVDQRSSATPIAGVRGLTDRVRFPGGTATFNTPQTNPTLANAVAGVPLWNFQEEAQFMAATQSLGFYGRGIYAFTPSLRAFAEFSFRRSEVQIDSASTPYFAINEIGDAPGGAGLFPRTNPYNPFGQDIVDLRWRMTELGLRIQDSTADTHRFLTGLQGDFPLLDRWTWEAALLTTKNTVSQLQRNYTTDYLVQDAFNGVTINGRRYHLNPFGPNAPELIEYLRITNPNTDSFEIRSLDASVSGPLFNLPAGEVSLALGAERRTEDFSNVGTALNRDGLLVGGGTGSDTFGDRSLTSAYIEASVPIAAGLEAQLAARFEDYSDFGNTTKPKVALVYRPMPEVLVRGSFGQSFLAPNLAFLYTSRSVSFTANTIPDPLRPNDPANQIRQFGGGNPGLEPEETDVLYGGLVLQPFVRGENKLLRELSFGVDYFKFEQENLINRLTAGQILGNLQAFGDLVLRNPPAPGETVGTISAVLTTWQNLTVGTYEGYDFNARWVLPENELGQLRFEASATYLDNVEGTTATGALFDTDGNYSSPLWRGSFTAAWRRGDWSAAVYANYIGKYTVIGSGRTGLPDIKAQWVVNPQVAWRGPAGVTWTLGARNILNDDPPIDLSDSKLVNENVNYVEPLFVYLRMSKNW